MKVTEQRALMKKLRSAMDIEVNADVNAEEWYSSNNINEENVRSMLRSTSRFARHFPKRNPCDMRINQFEPHIHSDHVQSNMDIQAIMSSEATIRYLLKYVLKPEPDQHEEAKQLARMPLYDVL